MNISDVKEAKKWIENISINSSNDNWNSRAVIIQILNLYSEVATVEEIGGILWSFLHTITVANENAPNEPHKQVIFKSDIPNIAKALLGKIPKQQEFMSEEEIFNLIKDVTPDLVEKNFPKGQCKERGAAIVLHAQMLIAISKALASKIPKSQELASEDEIADIITKSSLWNLGVNSHQALSELVEALVGKIPAHRYTEEGKK